MAKHITRHNWGYESPRQLVDMLRPDQPYVHRWSWDAENTVSVAQDGNHRHWSRGIVTPGCPNGLAVAWNNQTGQYAPALLGLE